jgi:hypothetical protein
VNEEALAHWGLLCQKKERKTKKERKKEKSKYKHLPLLRKLVGASS